MSEGNNCRCNIRHDKASITQHAAEQLAPPLVASCTMKLQPHFVGDDAASSSHFAGDDNALSSCFVSDNAASPSRFVQFRPTRTATTHCTHATETKNTSGATNPPVCSASKPKIEGPMDAIR